MRREPIYTDEVVELREKLKARGVCLLVIGGAKNTEPVEFSCAVMGQDILRLICALETSAALLKEDLAKMVAEHRDHHA